MDTLTFPLDLPGEPLVHVSGVSVGVDSHMLDTDDNGWSDEKRPPGGRLRATAGSDGVMLKVHGQRTDDRVISYGLHRVVRVQSGAVHASGDPFGPQQLRRIDENDLPLKPQGTPIPSWVDEQGNQLTDLWVSAKESQPTASPLHPLIRERLRGDTLRAAALLAPEVPEHIREKAVDNNQPELIANDSQPDLAVDLLDTYHHQLPATVQLIHALLAAEWIDAALTANSDGTVSLTVGELTFDSDHGWAWAREPGVNDEQRVHISTHEGVLGPVELVNSIKSKAYQ